MRTRKPNRLKNFDYSFEAMYFVTSCVQNMVHCFGHVENRIMVLNEYGKIAQNQWEWLQTQYPYAVSRAFVVMPNHIHAILEIDASKILNNVSDMGVVGAGRDMPPQTQMINNSMKIKSVSELMGAYKTTVSKYIHLAGMPEFKWQRSFHDHIIRDVNSFFNIRNYIETNPQKWGNDDLNSDK